VFEEIWISVKLIITKFLSFLDVLNISTLIIQIF